MTENQPDRDLYLELLDECYETLREATVERVDEIAEYAVEKRCDEAVGEHEIIGNVEEPRTNAAIIAVSIRTENVIADTSGHNPAVLFAELTPAEHLADLAHRAAKYDLIARVLDEQAEDTHQ
jgi:hypothetical protein